MKKFWKNPYIPLSLSVLFILGLGVLYNFYPQANNVALIITAVIVFAFVISGNFRAVWSVIKYLLLGLLIGVVLNITHIDYFPWGILLYILGVFVLLYEDGRKKGDQDLFNYISQMRSYGLSDQQIILNLQNSGWAMDKIQNVLERHSKKSKNA